MARFVAILGMMSQHLLGEGAFGVVHTVTAGFPSTLFAVLGGISAVVSTRRYRQEGRPVAASASLAVRGVMVAIVGVVLLLTPSFVVIVLIYYGVSLVVIAFLIHLRTWILIVIAAVLSVCGPFLIVWAAAGQGYGGAPGAVLSVLETVFFSGPYPVVTWTVYMLIGVFIGRALTRSSKPERSCATLAIVGAAMFFVGFFSDVVSRPMVVNAIAGTGRTFAEAEALATSPHAGVPVGSGWIAVLNAAPHSGTTADIVRTGGAAMLVIVGLVFATRRSGDRMPRALRIVARAGATPLTVYTAHVLLTALGSVVVQDGSQTAPPWWVLGPGALLLHVLGMLAIGWVLDAWHRRGPLETLVSAAARRGARLVGAH